MYTILGDGCLHPLANWEWTHNWSQLFVLHCSSFLSRISGHSSSFIVLVERFVTDLFCTSMRRNRIVQLEIEDHHASE
jgi:hypothetical protein